MYESPAYQKLESQFEFPPIQALPPPSSEWACFERDLPPSAFWIPAQFGLPETVKERIVNVFKTMHSLGIIHNSIETNLDSILIDADLRIHVIDFQHTHLRDDQSCDFDYSAELEMRRVKFLIDYDGARIREHQRTDVEENKKKLAPPSIKLEEPRTPFWPHSYQHCLIRSASRTRGCVLHCEVSEQDFEEARSLFLKLIWKAELEIFSRTIDPGPGFHPQTSGPLPSSFRIRDFANAPSAPPQPPTEPSTPLIESATMGDTLVIPSALELNDSHNATHPDGPTTAPIRLETKNALPSSSLPAMDDPLGQSTEREMPAGPSMTNRPTAPDMEANLFAEHSATTNILTRLGGCGGELESTAPRSNSVAHHSNSNVPSAGRALQREAAQYIISPPVLEDSGAHASSSVTRTSSPGSAVPHGANLQVQPPSQNRGTPLRREPALYMTVPPCSFEDSNSHASSTKETRASSTPFSIRKGKRKAVNVEEAEDAEPMQGAPVVRTDIPGAKRRKRMWRSSNLPRWVRVLIVSFLTQTVDAPTPSLTEAGPSTRTRGRTRRLETTTPSGGEVPTLRRSSRLAGTKSSKPRNRR